MEKKGKDALTREQRDGLISTLKHVSKVYVLVFMALSANSQDSLKPNAPFSYKNSVQAELAGHCAFYSINYERVLINHARFKTSGQIGCAYYPPATGVRDIWLPVLLTEQFSFNKHHIEVGIGHIFIYESFRLADHTDWFWDRFWTARIGYRYQKPEGRLVIRAAFTPVIEYREVNDFFPLGGIAIGYCL